MRIFIDQTAWMHLLDPKLPQHPAVAEAFNRALTKGDNFFTHNIAVGLALSEIKRTRGAEKANKFNEIIEEAYTGAHLSILWVGRRTQKDAIWMMRKNPDLQLDVYDFACYTLMKRRRIRTIMTTKIAYKHLQLNVIPEVGD